jgi:hypothetical protein
MPHVKTYPADAMMCLDCHGIAPRKKRLLIPAIGAIVGLLFLIMGIGGASGLIAFIGVIFLLLSAYQAQRRGPCPECDSNKRPIPLTSPAAIRIQAADKTK